MELNNKIVLVVGGTSGMGYAVAQQALAAGARVVVASRSADKVAKAAETLGAGASGEQVDVMDGDSVARLWERLGQVDHLVICAASIKAAGFRGASIEDAQASMDSKLWGPFRLIQKARIAPDGSILLFSGLASRRPSAVTGTLSAINAAVEAFGQALALELKPVRVNVICPGLVDTEYWDSVPPAVKESIFAATVARLPVGRVGTAGDIGKAAMTMLTNDYITGAVLLVDGGGALV